MTQGRVVRFDPVQGYGFVAPAVGGEDVFIHRNDLLVPIQEIRPGVMVEFTVEDSDRGPKASRIRLANTGAPAAVVPEASASLPSTRISEADAEGELYDILTPAELAADLAEILLAADPSLTGTQILAIRQRLLAYADRHGWTED